MLEKLIPSVLQQQQQQQQRTQTRKQGGPVPTKNKGRPDSNLNRFVSLLHLDFNHMH